MAMMGDNFDPSMLDEDRIAGQALEAVIGRKVLTQTAERMDLTLSEAEIGAAVAGTEYFQVDGEFSPEAYKSALSGAGYTPASYKEALRSDMLINQVRSGIAGTDFATPAELALNARILSEQRDIQYLTIPRETFAATAEPAPEAVQAWYDTRQEDFRAEESVDLDYIELTVEDFYQPVAEESVLEAYESARQDYQYQTRNRVSHILFEEGGERAVTERLAEAQARLSEGASFADVAGDLSDDVGSAGAGGDLGFSSGDAFPAEMEEAIAALEPGVVSGPVETEAGTHLILVTEREAGEPPSLDELRPQLEQAIQQEEASAELLRIVETLRDLSFNAEDLSMPAAELGLDVSQVDGITRGHAEGLMANAALLGAAYSDDVLAAGHNSEVIELADNRYVVLRVREHHPPEVQPLEDVRDQVVAAINEDLTNKALESEGLAVLRQVRQGKSIDEIAAETGYQAQVELAVDRRNAVVPFEVLERAFLLPEPESGASSSDLLSTRAGDTVVVAVTGVLPGDLKVLEAIEQEQLQRQTTAEFGALVNTEFERGLRNSADVSTLL